METLNNRTKATGPGFVSIPTGHAMGVPTFMTGYFIGEYADDGRHALVDFLGNNDMVTVKVVASAMLEATDAEIDDAIKTGFLPAFD